MPEDLDEQNYHEYLWGEGSPRAFAQSRKIRGNRQTSKTARILVADLQADDVDITTIVPR